MAFLTDDLQLRAFAQRIPWSVTFELTHRCNLSCKHCYVTDPTTGELSTADVRAVLDMLAEKQCLFLTVTGGELFLRPDALELIDYATRKGFALTVKTNGTLLTPETVHDLAVFNVMEVHISILGGTAEIHDGITGISGSFDAAWKAVDALTDAGITTVIMSVITRGATNGMELIHRRALQAGIDHVNYSAMLFPGYFGDIRPAALRLTDDELATFYTTTRRLYGKTVIAMEEPYNASDERFLSCTALQNGFTIQPDGTVIACQSVPDRLGNITRQSPESILFSKQADRIIQQLQLSSNSTCSHCEDRIGCLRCPGIACMEEGALNAVPQEACRHNRVFKSLSEETHPDAGVTV